MKRIMILGASILQLPAIEKALQLGLEPIVVDMNPDAVGFRLPGVHREVISTIDTPAILEAARRLQIDGIMTLASDMPMRSVAAVATELKLVGIDESTAIRATNKASMRQALRENQVPIPAFFKVSNETEYMAAAAQFSSPFVVKPADNSGSRGIIKVDDPADTRSVLQAYRYSVGASRNGDVLVEEYMRGPEVSVETLALDGVCHVIQITDKITTGSPHFVEIGHSQPTRLDRETADRIARVAIAANKAIGIEIGPSHTEIIVTEDGPKIVELGARLGGDCITTHLVKMSTGIDMVECCIRIALGEKPDISPKQALGAAIRYFPQHAGLVKKIEGLEEAKLLKGIRQISVVHGPGEVVTDIVDSGSRMGFVISQDKDAATAEQDCADAIERIKIKIERQ